MDEQQWNCVVGACCCEENCAEKRRAVLTAFLRKHLGHGKLDAAEVADLILTTFDVMPAGTLKPMIEAVTKFVQAGPYTG